MFISYAPPTTASLFWFYYNVARIEVVRFRYTVPTKYYTFVYFFLNSEGGYIFAKYCIHYFLSVYITFSFSCFSLAFIFYTLQKCRVYYMRVVYLCELECPYRVERMPCIHSYYAYSEYRVACSSMCSQTKGSLSFGW